MKRKTFDRRAFLQGSAALLGAAGSVSSAPGTRAAPVSGPEAGRAAFADNGRLSMNLTNGTNRKVWILAPADASFQERLASKELARGLRKLGLARAPIEAAGIGVEARAGDIVFTLQVDSAAFKDPEAYEIRQETAKANGSRVRLTGATPQAVPYAVFDFLERQGAFFGLDGDSYPFQPLRKLNLPPVNHPWHAQPRFKTRGLLPWPDFLNCITVYNREEHRAYLEAMLRMRFNTLGIHVYSGADQWAESFLSFEYAGAGHLAYTDTTATNRWGYLPEKTSNYGMGAPDYFEGEVFGSEATTRATSCWDSAKFAQQLWGDAFRYAKKLGIRTGVGFEPYQVPDEIYRATPPEAHYKSTNPKAPGPRIDPESVAARDILEARLGNLLESYPTVDYVWLWEDEAMNWASQNGSVPLSVTPYRQAYDFLKRHAPGKRLIVSGWGGVVRHFAQFHRQLPLDVIFTSLSDNLGWDPVSEEYGKLGERERWPIPWLEDDPAMWLPQFHVHRGAKDLDLAEKYQCQGVLGIHWRNRMMNVDAGFQARASWDQALKPAEFFRAFAATQAEGGRAAELADILTRTDRDRLILDSFTGRIENGHHQIHAFSGDYSEAFEFWAGYEPPEGVRISQAKVAHDLRALTSKAQSPAERERLDYLACYIEFLVPYSESWVLASRLHKVLQEAQTLKQDGKAAEAKQRVLDQGVPLWQKLASRVREALLTYQQMVSERNEQGALASVHNKFERLALMRLRLSMKEFLDELPAEVETLFRDVRRRDAAASPRVFIPTRPSALAPGEKVRVFAVAPGSETMPRLELFLRRAGSEAWQSFPMLLAGRRTFVKEIEPANSDSPLLEYYVEASFAGPSGFHRLTAPAGAPEQTYSMTLL
ncbi:MAG: hypothetical protein EPN47_16890 [Acidobacteria bacterium]|nr:MAG: hypothetical protein EPN47_16890 [Acidobacteriota bacterium]